MKNMRNFNEYPWDNWGLFKRLLLAQEWAHIFERISKQVGHLETLHDEYNAKNSELQRCFAKAPEFFREHMKSLIVQELKYISTINMTLGYEEWYAANMMYYFFIICADSAIFLVKGDDFELRRKLSSIVPFGFSEEVNRVKMMLPASSELPENLWQLCDDINMLEHAVETMSREVYAKHGKITTSHILALYRPIMRRGRMSHDYARYRKCVFAYMTDVVENYRKLEYKNVNEDIYAIWLTTGKGPKLSKWFS